MLLSFILDYPQIDYSYEDLHKNTNGKFFVFYILAITQIGNKKNS
jgi:hypothetical protein